jgi:presenilin-like A22 family membrane protease
MPKIKKEELKAPNFFKTVFLWEAILFSIVLFLGISSASLILKASEAGEIHLSELDFFDFLGSFLIVLAFIFFFSFFSFAKKKRGSFYKIIFSFTVWISGSLLLSLWMLDLLAFLTMGLIVFWRLKNPTVFNHNLCMILGLAGIGGVFALSINPETIVFLLVLFSIYDFIAVYKTKHMQKIAVEMMKHDAVLALIIPIEISDFGRSLKEKETKKRSFVLGGGDIAFPLLLSASLVREGLFFSSLVAIFSLFGLFFSFWIFYKKGFKSAMPALPPIALFSIIGYLVGLLLSQSFFTI